MLDTVLRKVSEWPKKNPAGFERDVVRAARRVVGSVSRGSRPTFDISGKSVPWCRAGGSATWPPGSRRERAGRWTVKYLPRGALLQRHAPAKLQIPFLTSTTRRWRLKGG